MPRGECEMANKTGPLSKSEKFYIEHNPDLLDVTDLAKELNRSVKQVQGFIDSLDNEEEKEDENKDKNTVEAVPKGQVGKLMGRKRGASIMTPAASSVSDKSKEQRNKKPGRHSDAIHKPLSDETERQYKKQSNG